MISGHRMRAISLALCFVCLAASGVALQAQSISASGVSARDPDQRFLREMIDHHEGLIYLVHEAMQRPISQKAHGIKLFDAFLRQIKRPRVREVALAIKRKEQREIAFHQRRLATH